MKRLFYDQQQDEKVDINMSPLIDCIFLLLIFFLVTSVFVKETGVKIDRPKAVSSENLERNSILVAITPDGQIHFDHQAVALSALRPIIRRELQQRMQPVIVLADTRVLSGRLVEVIDECKAGGAEQVSIATTAE